MIKDSHFSQFNKAIDAIHPIGSECFAQLKEVAKYRKLEKNEYFSRAGDFSKEFGFVIDGILRIFYLSEDGQEHNKHFLLRNSFVAASIKPDNKSITNIQALYPTRLICIEFASFVSLTEKFIQFSDFMKKLMESYLEEKQEREMQLLSNTAEKNYGIFLDNYPELQEKIPNITSPAILVSRQLNSAESEEKNLKNINICK